MNILSIILVTLTFACSEGNGGTTPPSEDLVADVLVTYNTDSIQHTISENVLGFNMSYMFCDDKFWENTEIKPALRNMQTGMLRYPDGAPTTYYHWNNLNGQGYKDNWDPNYDFSDDQHPREFTDLDEYMAICQETNITPLVGINMSSGLKHNRVDDGIQEAKDLVQYCLEKNYNVNHYFLDNEPYLKGGGGNRPMTVDEYIEQIRLYAPEIKKINPNAKLIINWEVNLEKGTFWKLITETHDLIDYIDAHWYWNWGDAHFSEWYKQLPMNSNNRWKDTDRSYKDELVLYRKKAKERGVDNVKLISLEWNISPSDNRDLLATPFQAALMQSEMLMQFMEGNMEIGTLWAFFWEVKDMSKRSDHTRYLMENYDNYRLLPCYDMFVMLSDAVGKPMGTTTSTSKAIYPIAVTNATRTEDHVFLLHKGMFETVVAIPTPKASKAILKIFNVDKKDTTLGGTTISSSHYDEETQAYYFTVPGFSLAQLTLQF